MNNTESVVACLRELHDYLRYESWFGLSEYELALLDRSRAALLEAEADLVHAAEVVNLDNPPA